MVVGLFSLIRHKIRMNSLEKTVKIGTTIAYQDMPEISKDEWQSIQDKLQRFIPSDWDLDKKNNFESAICILSKLFDTKKGEPIQDAEDSAFFFLKGSYQAFPENAIDCFFQELSEIVLMKVRQARAEAIN